jgi:hypothetical protein
MGKYRLNEQNESIFKEAYIETYTCVLQDTSIVAQGIFEEDGTCILPAKCGQTVEFNYQTGLYFVQFNGKQEIFDAEEGTFLPHLLRFSSYFHLEDGYYPNHPKGFIWLRTENRRLGLVRLSDGVPFFKED